MITTTIKLKKYTNKQYFISGLTTQQKTKLLEYHKRRELDKLSPLFGITCENIEMLGATKEANPSTLGKFIEALKGYEPSFKNKEKQVQFRDYSKTEEAQLKNAWLVKTCEDERSSALSLLRTIKEDFIVIWYIEIE